MRRSTIATLAWCIVLAMATVVAAAPPDVGVLVAGRRLALERMAPEARDAFAARVEAWDALPYDEAGRQREQYAALRALDGVDLARLRETRRLFGTLSPADQAALRERFAELTATEQHGWLLGPRLGADYAALSPLLLQVPANQREPLLALLRVMSPEERADLAVLAYRTPPQERDALRRALLETTDANRATWLRLRLER